MLPVRRFALISRIPPFPFPCAVAAHSRVFDVAPVVVGDSDAVFAAMDAFAVISFACVISARDATIARAGASEIAR